MTKGKKHLHIMYDKKRGAKEMKTDKRIVEARQSIMEETANQIDKARSGNWNPASPIAYQYFLEGTLQELVQQTRKDTLKDVLIRVKKKNRGCSWTCDYLELVKWLEKEVQKDGHKNI
jgi:hypothetical protein